MRRICTWALETVRRGVPQCSKGEDVESDSTKERECDCQNHVNTKESNTNGGGISAGG
jgi:hypothetical protein